MNWFLIFENLSQERGIAWVLKVRIKRVLDEIEEG